MAGGWRSLHIKKNLALHQIFLDNQIKKDEMGRKCSEHGGDGKCL